MALLFSKLLVLISFSAQAQVNNAPIFRVNTPHGDSYLLGTIHIGVNLKEFNVDVAKLIGQSRIFLPELDLTDEQLELLRKDPYRLLAELKPFSQANLDLDSKKRFKELGVPDYIVNSLGDSDCGFLDILIGFSAQQTSMDDEALRIAHSNHLEIQALDTIELRKEARAHQNKTQGICSFKKIFSSYSNEQILSELKNSSESDVAAYRRGDAIPLEQLNGPIVTDRNLAWLPAVQSEITNGKAFIAVGAAHLFGPLGLINLLRASGYTVGQIN